MPPPDSTTAAPSPGRSVRDERQRRSLVALVVGVAAFAGLELAAAVFQEGGGRRDPIYNGPLARLRARVRAAPERPLTVVMLGSSRTHSGLRAPELTEPLTRACGRPVVVVNFGVPSYGPTTHLVTWNRLCCDGARPDLVLIEVLPAMYSENWPRVELTAERLPLCRVRRCDLPVFERLFSDVRPELRRDWWLSWPNALYNQRLTLLSRVAPTLLPFADRIVAYGVPEDEPTETENITPEHRRQALEYARANYADTVKQFRLGGQVCDSLRELVACVRRDGARPVIVVMPEGPEFRSWYAAGAYDQLRRWLDEFAAEFDAGLIDAHEWMDEGDFVDSHHLTRCGGAKFTARLGEEYLAPLVREIAGRSGER